MRRVILFGCMLGLFLPLWAQEIPLTSDSYDHWSPQWSLDGSWIVYYKEDATGYDQIYKVLSGGGTETALTSEGCRHYYPQWSPDGNWIVYYRGDATGYCQIYKTPSGVGIEESSNSHFSISNYQLSVEPNPFTCYAEVRSGKEEVRNIQIYDLSGRLVETTKGNTIGENLRPGIYFLKIECSEIPQGGMKVVKLR